MAPIAERTIVAGLNVMPWMVRASPIPSLVEGDSSTTAPECPRCSYSGLELCFRAGDYLNAHHLDER